MNKVSINTRVWLGMLLILLIALSCSEENVIVEEIPTPIEEIVNETSAVKTYVEAQNTVFQFLTAIASESIKGSYASIINSSDCPEVENQGLSCGGSGSGSSGSGSNGTGTGSGSMSSSGSGGDSICEINSGSGSGSGSGSSGSGTSGSGTGSSTGKRLIIDYDYCTDNNGHLIDGKIFISTCAEDLIQTTVDTPGCIKLEHNKIIIAHCKLKIKGPSKHIQFYNVREPGQPAKFVFLLEEGTYFKVENLNNGDETEITPSLGTDGSFLEMTPDITLSLDIFSSIYNAEYQVKMLQNETADPMWKAEVDPNDGPVEELRTTTGDDLVFSPSYAFAFDGSLLSYLPPSGGVHTLLEDWHFGADASGCTDTPVRDSFVEICPFENQSDCSNSSCSVSNMDE